MKTLIKTGLAALVIAIFFTACDPPKAPANAEKIDTGKTTTAIDTTQKTVVDSAKTAVNDSTKK